MKFIGKLKQKWGVGNWDFVAIMIAFSLAGMSIVRFRKLILDAILPDDLPIWLYLIIYIPIAVPIYQILLLFYGTILGQFRFFWEKEKKILAFIGRMIPKITNERK